MSILISSIYFLDIWQIGIERKYRNMSDVLIVKFLTKYFHDFAPCDIWRKMIKLSVSKSNKIKLEKGEETFWPNYIEKKFLVKLTPVN